MRKSVSLNEDSSEYMEVASNYERKTTSKNKFPFISKIFLSKKKINKTRRRISPPIKRVHQANNNFPHYEGNGMFVVSGEEFLQESDFDDSLATDQPQYNVLFIEGTPVKKLTEQEKRHFNSAGYTKHKQELNRKDELLGETQRHESASYFEVVKVEDRGTDPWEMTPTAAKKMEDKSTDAMSIEGCQHATCEKEREQLCKDRQEMENTIKSSMNEGDLLVKDIEKIKKHIYNWKQSLEMFGTHLNRPQETPTDFVHLGRLCLMELGKQLLATQKQTEAEIRKLNSELNAVKKENIEKEEKCKNIENKIEVQNAKLLQDGQDNVKLQSKIGKLQDSLETGKKILREAEKSFKVIIEKLESELTSQKQSNAQMSQTLKEKCNLITQLESNIEKLQNCIETNKQQLKEIHYSYKSKIAKLEAEHTDKMSALCENQTSANKQLSKALDQSSNYVNEIQETKKENTALSAANKIALEKISVLERELAKEQERCSVAERKLSRETQEVLALQSQVEQLETMKEEELLSIDGDIWCQIMYQQDQWVLDDLMVSLQEKETHLESLRAQGDCALKDFEKMQNELHQRRQQFNELKDVFLDFEKKRDIVVREQRDFYNKMVLLSRRTIPRDRFFKNLIKECQSKTYKIEELKSKVDETDNVIEETKRITEAQLKAMQAEMKFTAEKLYEFENQIRFKEMQLQDIIRVFEQEKKNKVAAEEAMNTYKILLEDAKKENSEIRSKLNFLEDLEKNRTNVLKITEELAKETQKRQNTEVKLKNLEKDFVEMKNQMRLKGDKCSPRMETFSGNTKKEVEQLKVRLQDLKENKKYMERILMESQRSKESLQKDHEDLYNKMRHAVRIMVESKDTQESLELKLQKRMHAIQELQRSQADTENQLDVLKDVLDDMKQTIESLQHEREELRDRLANHTHCTAERALHQEMKLLQRDKALADEQNVREKESLLHRLMNNEDKIKEQHNHLRAFQDQLDSLNSQLRDAKGQLASERHNHTQQLLTLQSDKKKLELYIQELEARLSFETNLRLKSSDTSPQYLNSSDSYEPPIRDHNKHLYHRK